MRARPLCDAAHVVLAAGDKRTQSLRVDHVVGTEKRNRRTGPEAVARVLGLVRPTLKAAALTLRAPGNAALLGNASERTRHEMESGDSTKSGASVRLDARRLTEAALEGLRGENVCDGGVAINARPIIENVRNNSGAVRKANIALRRGILGLKGGKGAVALLQTLDARNDVDAIDAGQVVTTRQENLQCALSHYQVRIVVCVSVARGLARFGV